MIKKIPVKIYGIVVAILIIGFVIAGIKIFANKAAESSGGDISVNVKEMQHINYMISKQQFRADPIRAALGGTDGAAGLVELKFQKAPQGYFEDALFIGDSRTVGLEEYGNIEGADFFATEGMSVYSIYKETSDISGVGNVSLKTLLQSKQYGKVYIMLGINELGYRLSDTAARYKDLIDKIQKYQPDALIFIEANLHVSAELSRTDKIFKNSRIDNYNNMLAKLADNRSIFYIDANEIFDDADGGLGREYTSDNIHIMGKYYGDWGAWIAQKAIVK